MLVNTLSSINASTLNFCIFCCSVSIVPPNWPDTMNCQQCAKVIPDGFIDCPWCGTARRTPAPIPTASVPTDWLTASALSLSMLCLFGFSSLSISRDKAANPLASPPYFSGEWMSTYFWAVVILIIFAVIHKKRVRSSVKFLAIVGPGFLLGLMSLSKPTPHLKPDPARIQSLTQVIKNPSTANLDKWDLALRPFYTEVISRNRQYIDDVSKLDNDLQPLYSPASFRDAQSIQAMLNALDQRLAIADKYADIQPVFAKVPGYVAQVDATDREKREFLAGFNDTAPKNLTAKNSVSSLEHKWVFSAIDLYKFSLAHQGSYSYNPGNVTFKDSVNFAVFKEKLYKSRENYSQFLKAYSATRRAQDAFLAQAGLQPSDIGLDNPK